METLATALFWIIIVAIVMSATRPGSIGAQAVIDVSNAFAAAGATATGYQQE
jgi:hypothetical protein